MVTRNSWRPGHLPRRPAASTADEGRRHGLGQSCHGSRRIVGLLLLSCLAVLPAAARAGQYGHRIIADPSLVSSKIAGPAVADLQHYLGMITGESYEVTSADAQKAISLRLTGSPNAPPDAVRQLSGKGLFPFYIHGNGDRLEITANDEHGLTSGIAYYLESLGVRWLLPGDHWTVVPRGSDITRAVDKLVQPAFLVRSYFGTGGFYSHHWGNFYSGSAVREAETTAWQRRLGFGGEFTLGGAVGEGFIADKTIMPILQQHPEFLAQVGGQPSPLYITDKNGRQVPNVLAKLNAGNPAAVDLFCRWTLDRLRRQQENPDKSRHDVVSVEPSDGYGYGDNIADLPGNGSGSDQTFFIANQCAKKVRAVYPQASVLLLGYGGHAAPPSFALEPNVIVQLAPYAFQTTPPEQFIASWRAKAPKLAMYDYWSIPDWKLDVPGFDYLGVGDKLRYWLANGVIGFNAESTYSGGAMGLSLYIAEHIMWNPTLTAQSLADDWFRSGFEAAQMPIRRMFERWRQSFHLTSAEIATSFRDLSEAEALAAGNSAVTARIDDLACYVQYLRLRLEADNATDAGTKELAKQRMVEFMLDIDDRLMVGTIRIFDLAARSDPALLAAFALSAQGRGPGWSTVRALTHEDVMALIEAGTLAYPIPDWQPKTYSEELVPLGADVEHAAWQPVMPVIGDLDLEVVVPQSSTGLHLRVKQPNVTATPSLDVVISDQARHPVFKRTAITNQVGDGEALYVPLQPGRYVVHFRPSGGRVSGFFSFQLGEAYPAVMQHFLSPKTTPSPRLYFFVPRGLKKIVLFNPAGDLSTIFKFQVLTPAGTAAPISFSDHGTMMEVPVGGGQDGAVWSLVRLVSPNEPLRMLNAPEAFALSPDTLMVPREALQ